MAGRQLRLSHLGAPATTAVGASACRRRGFTLIEAVIVVAILGIMAAVASPRMSGMTERQRVDRASLIVASDIRAAFSSAARGRVPVRVDFVFTNRRYAITNRVTGDTIIQRDLSVGDMRVSGMTGPSATFDVFPSGVATVADTIMVGGATQYHRRVAVSRVGAVRVLP